MRNKSSSFVQVKLLWRLSTATKRWKFDLHPLSSCCVLTENCTVFARLHGILLVLPPEWWAPSLQSQYTVSKWVQLKNKQKEHKSQINIHILMSLRGNLRNTRKANSQYLDLQFMINGKSRVLERLDDRCVGVGQLCVFSNQGYSHVFQKTIRSEMRRSLNYLIWAFNISKWNISTPVSHLFPLYEHFPGTKLHRHIQTLAEVVHNPLFFQQEGYSVNGGDVLDTDHLKMTTKDLPSVTQRNMQWTIFTLWSHALKYFTCEGSTWQNIEILSFTTVSRGVEQRHIIWSQSGQCC